MGRREVSECVYAKLRALPLPPVRLGKRDRYYNSPYSAISIELYSLASFRGATVLLLLLSPCQLATPLPPSLPPSCSPTR